MLHHFAALPAYIVLLKMLRQEKQPSGLPRLAASRRPDGALAVSPVLDPELPLMATFYGHDMTYHDMVDERPEHSWIAKRILFAPHFE